MANNTNQQAINFCNQKLRPAIDAVVTAYMSMFTLSQEWAASGVAAVIPNDGNLVQDGATPASGQNADGRAPITDAAVNAVISTCNALIADFQANNNAILEVFAPYQVNAKSVI
jgi:hypothetical protein